MSLPLQPAEMPPSKEARDARIHDNEISFTENQTKHIMFLKALFADLNMASNIAKSELADGTNY
jgi:hypothetical protein